MQEVTVVAIEVPRKYLLKFSRSSEQFLKILQLKSSQLPVN